MNDSSLALAFGVDFAALYRRDGLLTVDREFLAHLAAADTALHARLLAARERPDALAAKEESTLIVALAPHLERFVAKLFGIEDAVAALSGKHGVLAPIYGIKRQFVRRRAANRIPPEEAREFDGPALERELRRLFGGRFDELTFATYVARWLEAEFRAPRRDRPRAALRRVGCTAEEGRAQSRRRAVQGAAKLDYASRAAHR